MEVLEISGTDYVFAAGTLHIQRGPSLITFSHNLDFGVASRNGLLNRTDDSFCGRLDSRPAWRAQDYDRNAPVLEILLILEVEIGSNQDLESLLLRGRQQLAVL